MILVPILSPSLRVIFIYWAIKALVKQKTKDFFQNNQDYMSIAEQFICFGMDEEGRGYLGDQKSQWNNLGLAPNQIKIKELIFIFDHHRGRFVSWLKLPRFLSSTRIK